MADPRTQNRRELAEKLRADAAPGPDGIIASDEWGTPEYIVEACRAAAGGLDVDPCSGGEAENGRIRAAKLFTIDNSGLAPEATWESVDGTPSGMLVNPPFSGTLPREFAEKLLEEYDAGRVRAWIWLQNSSSAGSSYAQDLQAAARFVVHLAGRVSFIPHAVTGRTETSNSWSSVMLICGGDVDPAPFAEIGTVLFLAPELEPAVDAVVPLYMPDPMVLTLTPWILAYLNAAGGWVLTDQLTLARSGGLSPSASSSTRRALGRLLAAGKVQRTQLGRQAAYRRA